MWSGPQIKPGARGFVMASRAPGGSHLQRPEVGSEALEDESGLAALRLPNANRSIARTAHDLLSVSLRTTTVSAER